VIAEYVYGTDGNQGHWLTGEEIVRCRDCRYYDDEPDLTSDTPKCWRDPEHRGTAIWTRPDGFCAWGERKDGR